MTSSIPNVTVQIERLILDGLPLSRAQGALVQASLEAELGRLLTEGGIAENFAPGGAVPLLRANAIDAASADPAQLGTQIARAVYGGIGQ
jgi:hypothetical protein